MEILEKEKDLKMNTDLLQLIKITINQIKIKRKFQSVIKMIKIKKIKIKKITVMKFKPQFQMHKT